MIRITPLLAKPRITQTRLLKPIEVAKAIHHIQIILRLGRGNPTPILGLALLGRTLGRLSQRSRRTPRDLVLSVPRGGRFRHVWELARTDDRPTRAGHQPRELFREERVCGEMAKVWHAGLDGSGDGADEGLYG